jgi:hypothetical protein
MPTELRSQFPFEGPLLAMGRPCRPDRCAMDDGRRVGTTGSHFCGPVTRVRSQTNLRRYQISSAADCQTRDPLGVPGAGPSPLPERTKHLFRSVQPPEHDAGCPRSAAVLVLILHVGEPAGGRGTNAARVQSGCRRAVKCGLRVRVRPR